MASVVSEKVDVNRQGGNSDTAHVLQTERKDIPLKTERLARDASASLITSVFVRLWPPFFTAFHISGPAAISSVGPNDLQGCFCG